MELQIQPQLDTKAFLVGASGMDVQDLEAFVRELNGVIFQKKTSDKDYRQRELLRGINQAVLPQEKRSQYWKLAEKMEAETLSDAEQQTFLKLVEEEETLRNERVKMMLELAQLRNISLNQLMLEMGLQPIGHG